jgi:hypothetical protein
MATRSSKSRCQASTTIPIPPTPITRSTRYLPFTTVPGATSCSRAFEVEVAMTRSARARDGPSE